MPCTPEQLAANRRNSAKSTGPITPEGKERSRANGLKHGQSGAGIVLTPQVAAEVERRAEVFGHDLGAKSEFDFTMVYQIAVGSVRFERSFEQETAAVALRVRHAGADYDENRAGELDELISHLDIDPTGTVRRLKARPDGIDWLIASWLDLKEELLDTSPISWSPNQRERFETLMGLRVGLERPAKLIALFQTMDNWFDFRKPEDTSGIDRAIQTRKELAGRVDLEIERLEIDRANLDHEALALDRAEAGARALFDPSPEAKLARRYEADAQRSMFRALRELEKSRELPCDESPEPETTSAELASSRQTPEPKPLEEVDWSHYGPPSQIPAKFREMDAFLDEFEARLDREIEAMSPGIRRP